MQYPDTRITLAIPTASYDGIYYARYPNGDKPALVGTLMDSSGAYVTDSAANVITTQT